MAQQSLDTLKDALRNEMGFFERLEADLVSYLSVKQERHEQLVRRYERVQRRMAALRTWTPPKVSGS